MGFYKVTVVETKEVSYYVYGDDRSMVQEDAEELYYGGIRDEGDIDIDIDIFPVDKIGPGEEYWSGGPEGDWVRTDGK